MDNGEDIKTVNFWYEIETTHKGEQVSKIWLNANNIPQRYTDELCILKHRVEDIWSDLKSPITSSLDLVTEELVGVKRKHELSVERDKLESQLKAIEEERNKLENQLKAIEEERRKKAEQERQNEVKRIANKYYLIEEEADELEQLLAYIRSLKKKFIYSNRLSKYIVEHQLGRKYPNISGIVTMEDGSNQWKFYGGFDIKIYKIICEELDLKSQETSARPVDFTPYRNIY